MAKTKAGKKAGRPKGSGFKDQAVRRVAEMTGSSVRTVYRNIRKSPKEQSEKNRVSLSTVSKTQSKRQQSGPVLGSNLKLVRRTGRRKVPKLPLSLKTKATPRFMAKCLAYKAYYHFETGDDPHWVATVTSKAALAGGKVFTLFIHYLDKYLKEKPIRLPLSQKQRKLLDLYYKNPHLRASEALNKFELDHPSKGAYRRAKGEALEHSRLMQQINREIAREMVKPNK